MNFKKFSIIVFNVSSSSYSSLSFIFSLAYFCPRTKKNQIIQILFVEIKRELTVMMRMMIKVRQKMRAVKKLAGRHESADGSLRYVSDLMKKLLNLYFFVNFFMFSYTHNFSVILIHVFSFTFLLKLFVRFSCVFNITFLLFLFKILSVFLHNSQNKQLKTLRKLPMKITKNN
jgi:hypothetical protein